MIPSICLNETRKSLSESPEIPGITTTANPNTRPATKEHNKIDNINEIENISSVILEAPD
jgi:hypothetical protein